MSIASALRKMADWYDEHPEMPPPQEDGLSIYGLDSKEEAAQVVAALGSCEKSYADDLLCISRDFGGLRLRFVFMRRSVCERRVIGQQVIPEHVVPERTVDIVEWDCGPVLAPEDPQSQTAEDHVLSPEEARQNIIEAGDF